MRKSNITVDFLPEASLPPVVADPNQLMQVFLNLLLNAEQAIRETREKGTIRVRIGRNEDTVWVVFQDDGPGINLGKSDSHFRSVLHYQASRPRNRLGFEYLQDFGARTWGQHRRGVCPWRRGSLHDYASGGR